MTDLKKVHSGGAWLVLSAALLWGTTGTAQTFAPAGFDPVVIGGLRLAIGGFFLMLLALSRREIRQLRSWPWKPVFLAAAATATYQVCFFAAVAKTGVAVGTVVGIGSAPIIAGLIGFFFLGQRPGRRWGGATFLAIIGCSLLALSSSQTDVQINPIGLLLALVAGTAYAAYTFAIKELLKNHSPNAVMAVIVCMAALLLLPLLLGRELSWVLQPRGIAVVFYLGLFTMALSYWLFARGLLATQATTAVTLTLAEPMTAALLGVAVVGEKLSIPAWAGLLLIGCGLLILTVPTQVLRMKVQKW